MGGAKAPAMMAGIGAPGASAASLSTPVLSCPGQAGGGVIAVATPDATPEAREMRALAAAGFTALPVRHPWALPAVVAQLRPNLVLLDVALCHTAVVDVLAELAALGAPAVILCGALPDAGTRAALLYAGADDCVAAPYLVDEL
ncbi:MAG: hypothetical protein ABJC62_10550, partial [Frankiaceae bacterium]